MNLSAFLFFSLTMFSLFTFAQEVVPVTAPVETVQVAEPAAPPKWAEEMLMSAQDIPVIGPIVGKVLLYAGIVSSIATALVSFLFTVLTALARLSSLARLASLAATLQTIRNSKVMYWLTYISMFNAVKPQAKSKAPETSEQKAA